MSKNTFDIVEAICNECSNTITFPRSTRSKLHIFSTQGEWCYKCKKYTTFYILFDKNYAYSFLNEKKELSDTEAHVLTLLKRNLNQTDENIKTKK